MEAILMVNDIPLKKCTTCKHTLSYDQFSDRTTNPRKYPDGVDTICKPCMRWYRKRSYARAKDPNYHAPISRVPLRDHNLATLDSYIDGKFVGEYSIPGKSVNGELVYELLISFEETSKWHAKLVLRTCKQETSFETSTSNKTSLSETSTSRETCKSETSFETIRSWTVYSTINWKSFSGNFLDSLWEDEIRLVEKPAG